MFYTTSSLNHTIVLFYYLIAAKVKNKSTHKKWDITHQFNTQLLELHRLEKSTSYFLSKAPNKKIELFALG
jgi:hypothetical protein